MDSTLFLSTAVAQTLPNGFSAARHLIPIDQILSGGPGKDGIPAILKPRFESVREATWLEDDDEVVVVSYKGEQRAYPLRVLVWHEIVNDVIAGQKFAVTYCPLCGSSIVFLSPENTTFGVSGLLYQSDVLMYDHQSDSLWSQLMFKAVTGTRAGDALTVHPAATVHWGAWKADNLNGKVLSQDTGHRRDYSRDPYLDYRKSTKIMFPVEHSDARLHPKTPIFVVLLGEHAKAYPLKVFETTEDVFNDRVAGEALQIVVKNGRPLSARLLGGEQLQSFNAYWFAWYTFRADTLLFDE